MKVAFLVNSISKTSIPLRWSLFFNEKNVAAADVFSLKDFLKSPFRIARAYDIMHGHHAKSMYAFLLLNAFLRKPSVYTVHGSYLFLSGFNKWITGRIFRLSDRIVFVNKTLHDLLPEKEKKAVEGKYAVILNGVEKDYAYQKADVYSKFNIPDGTILFHPARFVEEKNHIRLLEAFAIVAARKKDALLVMAGDGKLRPQIEKTIAELGIGDHVLMIGLINRDEVYCFLERCDLFLMPSISEGLNVSFLEAISMKSRIVVSNIDQFVYPLQFHRIEGDTINVSFADPLSPEHIAEAILERISRPRNTGDEGDAFSLDFMAARYAEIYTELQHDR